ncbi:hypothetical protein KIPB_007973, partial [Kipferlia bialata]
VQFTSSDAECVRAFFTFQISDPAAKVAKGLVSSLESILSQYNIDTSDYISGADDTVVASEDETEEEGERGREVVDELTEETEETEEFDVTPRTQRIQRGAVKATTPLATTPTPKKQFHFVPPFPAAGDVDYRYTCTFSVASPEDRPDPVTHQIPWQTLDEEVLVGITDDVDCEDPDRTVFLAFEGSTMGSFSTPIERNMGHQMRPQQRTMFFAMPTSTEVPCGYVPVRLVLRQEDDFHAFTREVNMSLIVSSRAAANAEKMTDVEMEWTMRGEEGEGSDWESPDWETEDSENLSEGSSDFEDGPGLAYGTPLKNARNRFLTADELRGTPSRQRNRGMVISA